MAKSRKPTANDNRLLALLERIERLLEERKALASDIGAIYAEAKSAGFDPRAMKQMVKERAMDPDIRAAWQAQLQIYRAALGMLDDTPLGAAARRRFSQQPDPPPPDGGGDAPDDAAPPAEPPPAALTAEELLKAKAEGAAAQKAGKMVLLNPYAADDPRRAAWDEGWCAAAGSDGMDVPAAFRRNKPKDDKGDGKPGGQPPGGE